ncbi:hypothetical protein FRACYDRAFT_236565 [Fragilariopsis cylindrus CCMP1102]|uniref:HSF-type DNA-binding domain-containing protein n=1 Tax=Fragilariopsis cylindrus CCMP1102 TaxID=635003 RepID=A0A1E7FJF9_9STRA|nr:hypothetical protein FRACYDRAFT_236565 [Fragilariopsis cylindrus CCMP1102]|eukprot:OEU18288.1 hypothetical protein FRACYDRAFT_236565 [Fragilariopsis cylindrus CCMP1102]
MILSRPPPPSDNNSSTGTATTRPRDMTLCSSYYYENENEDIVFEGKLGDTLAAHFLPSPTPTPTLSSSSSMEWNKNKNSSGVSNVLSTRTSKKLSFPETLHRILDDVADGNVCMTSSSAASEMISWEEMGKGFRIYQPKPFNEMILSKYARRKTKYRSFQRQLNIYGFKLNRRSGIYHHENFTRGDIRSLKKIRPAPNKNYINNSLRKTSKNTYKSSSSRYSAVAVEQRRVRERSIVSSEEDGDSASSSSSASFPIISSSPSPEEAFSGGIDYNIMPIVAGIYDDCLEDIDVTNISNIIDIDTTTSNANAKNTAVYTVFDDRDFLSDISDIPVL